MTRTTSLKLGYLAAVVALGSAVAWVVTRVPQRQRLGVMLLLAAVLLVPGRILGHVHRDLFVGRRLLDAGAAREAVAHFERFLAAMRSAPWKKKLLWLGWSVYTTDVEAMALNDLGAARLATGAWDDAARDLRAALALDPRYPLPHANLALLAMMRGRDAEAREELARARALGFSDTASDALVRRAQQALAQAEGRGGAGGGGGRGRDAKP